MKVNKPFNLINNNTVPTQCLHSAYTMPINILLPHTPQHFTAFLKQSPFGHLTFETRKRYNIMQYNVVKMKEGSPPQSLDRKSVV